MEVSNRKGIANQTGPERYEASRELGAASAPGFRSCWLLFGDLSAFQTEDAASKPAVNDSMTCTRKLIEIWTPRPANGIQRK